MITLEQLFGQWGRVTQERNDIKKKGERLDRDIERAIDKWLDEDSEQTGSNRK